MMTTNKSYEATEFLRESMEPTGHVWTFLSPSREEAVESLLYTLRLKNGDAFSRNYCAYSGRFCYSIPEPSK